jgi:hypothetical protein
LCPGFGEDRKNFEKGEGFGNMKILARRVAQMRREKERERHGLVFNRKII